jgi:YD repeat-containing protein
MKPTQTTRAIRDEQGNNLTTTTQYYYDSDYVLPIRIDNTTSTGEVISEEIRYLDNALWLPLETSTYRMNADGSNKRLVGSEYTTWDEVKSLPLKVYQIESSTPLTNFVPGNKLSKDSRYVEKHSYDLYGTKGNLQQEHSPGGIYTSYLWDATNTYPMAQVQGATYSQISSEDGKVEDYDSVSLIDRLKSLTPSTAFIQTYSYKLLVGVSQQTDTNGKTTYYDYDSFGRLITIRDNNFKILKSYNYHYSTNH